MTLTTTILLLLSLCFAGLFLWALRQAQKATIDLARQASKLSLIKQEHAQLQDRVLHLQEDLKNASQDHVTQLPSWTLFEDRLNVAIDESGRHHFIFALLFVEIAGFKLINNALGKHASDNLLKDVATRLKTCVRKVDSLSRYSQSTFAFLLARLSTPEKAAIVAERILTEFSEPFQVSGKEMWLNVNIGITVFPSDGQESTALISHARQALYLAKKQGKQFFYFYQDEMSHNSQRELALAASFSQKTLLEQLQLNCQPVMDVARSQVAFIDAGFNWQHPEFGLVSSSEVARLASEQHKLNEVTMYLLRQACKQFQEWQTIGFSPACVAIKISAKQLADKQFIYEISNTLKDIDFNPEQLMLKIELSINEYDESTVKKSINMLQYIGIKLALNHFGASYLPLNYLKEFSFDFIRLDEALFYDLVDNQQTQALLMSIKQLADNLSLGVMVVGISSNDHVAKLQEMGFNLMHGQLEINVPLPVKSEI